MNLAIATPPAPCPSVADTPAKRVLWWTNLEPQWQTAFGLAFLGHLDPPTPDELEALWRTPVLRFAGPHAPYPNLQIELTNCSGLVGMRQLETLVLTDHLLESVAELAGLQRLTALFLNNNCIRDLSGMESLTGLTQLHLQQNPITSLEPLRELHQLRELNVSRTELTSLAGITLAHETALRRFYCLPNEQLSDRAIMQFERELGIRCRTT